MNYLNKIALLFNFKFEVQVIFLGIKAFCVDCLCLNLRCLTGLISQSLVTGRELHFVLFGRPAGSADTGKLREDSSARSASRPRCAFRDQPEGVFSSGNFIS